MQPRSSRYLAIARYSSGSEMFARYITWSMTTYMPGLPFASTAAACNTRRAFSGIPQTSDNIYLQRYSPAAKGVGGPPGVPVGGKLIALLSARSEGHEGPDATPQQCLDSVGRSVYAMGE